MTTPFEDASPRIEDIRRIALVTERFTELQGLNHATLGAVFILTSLLFHLFGSPDRSGVPLEGLTFGLLIAEPLMLQYLRRRYRQGFGDVVATMGQKFLATLPFAAVMVGAVLDAAPFQKHPPILGPSFMAIAFTCSAIWVLLRDWRWRPHYLVALAAGLAAVAVTASVPSSGLRGPDPARITVLLLAYALIGVGFVITGLFDHHLLVSTLRRRGSRVPVTDETGMVNVDTL